MRINLTKEEIVNSIYMQIGYSKKISETLLEDFFDIILQNLKKSKMNNNTKDQSPLCIATSIDGTYLI